MSDKYVDPYFLRKAGHPKVRPVQKIGHPEPPKRKNMKTFRAPGVK